MNKQELIKKFEETGIYDLNLFGTVVNSIPTKTAITLIKQLDEPQPVKVQQFVADWYEENKDDFETSLFQCVYELFKKRNDEELNEFENWVIDENTKPFQTLVNMHQFGYEVEKEKRYLVRVKGISGYCQYLNQLLSSKEYFFASKTEIKGYRIKHTRKELEEAGFGWVFDCPGVEIEEMEHE